MNCHSRSILQVYRSRTLLQLLLLRILRRNLISKHLLSEAERPLSPMLSATESPARCSSSTQSSATSLSRQVSFAAIPAQRNARSQVCTALAEHHSSRNANLLLIELLLNSLALLNCYIVRKRYKS